MLKDVSMRNVEKHCCRLRTASRAIGAKGNVFLPGALCRNASSQRVFPDLLMLDKIPLLYTSKVTSISLLAYIPFTISVNIIMLID